jgi:transposase InsO family protein
VAPSRYNPYQEKTIFLKGKIDRKTALTVVHNLKSIDCPYFPADVVPPHEHADFLTLLQRRFPMDEEKQKECESWTKWSRERFCTELLDSVPSENEKQKLIMGFLESISRVKVNFDLNDSKVEDSTDREIRDIVDAHPEVSQEEQDEAVKVLVRRIPDTPVNWRGILLRPIAGAIPKLTSVSIFRFVWLAQLKHCRELIQTVSLFGITCIYLPASRQLTTTTKKEEPASKKRSLSSDDSKSVLCAGCGRSGHESITCHFKNSKYFNGGSGPYIDSKAYALLKRDKPAYTEAFLPRDFTKPSVPSSSSTSSSSSSAKQSNNAQAQKRQSKILASAVCSECTLTPPDPVSHFISLYVSRVSDQNIVAPRNKVEVLMDTGSLAGNFVLRQIVVDLGLTSDVITSLTPVTVCSGLDNHCIDIYDSITLKLSYYCSLLNNYASFQIQALILENSQLQVIVGVHTIRALNLFHLLPKQLVLKSIPVLSAMTCSCCVSTSQQVCMPCGCQPDGDFATPEGSPTANQSSQIVPPATTQTQTILASLVFDSEKLLGHISPDDDEIDDHLNDSFSPWLDRFPSTDPLSLIHISGDEDLQNQIRMLCNEFRDIFSDTLPDSAADIPPFELIVDDTKWASPRNRTPPRPQSTANQVDIVKQITELENAGIIEKSSSPYYSQVLMVPKPDGSKRMCIDYRNLNDCTPDASWPIPNIAEMLRRIGNHKPKIFGTMDLTQGYHQAPITLATRAYTSFILFCGVYQFTRLPFGPKRAPSYFQQVMATVVLAGLIYITCEMYIDDCNVFGKNTNEFISRLRGVFLRFRTHKLFLKAKKCYFGYAEIDFVGKVLSENGLQMSQAKIRSVLDFPKPIIAKQLKSFLGLVNYFRDFIRNQSSIVHPLHQLILNYNKTKKIIWTLEADACFDLVKSEVAKCTTMHFLDDHAPISLQTDASDYGVGGYLFQRVDGKEIPVAFVSKSLSKTQLRWSVIQKEAYAIFYSCTYLKSLLRDRKFTIFTDHRNLLFISQSSNPMIVRWLMALSEFSFKVEFIAGVDNGIADSMSRLCRNNMVDSPKEYTPEVILAANIITKFKVPSDKYSIISSVHNSSCGHYGLERTLLRLQKLKHKWQFQRQHVRYFIDHCPCCQKMSMLKTPIHAHGFSTSTYTPMECLNIDFIGPFPDGGFVLVIIDTFTRWVELFHTKDASALSAATCLFQHFGRFGAPLQLRSDNGPHFIADLIREFLALVGTQHCLTLVYSKEENAIVERMNKEINRHLRALTFDNTSLENYSQSLPFVQRILNSNHSDRLKISASQLLFGNVLNLDRGIFLPAAERLLVESKPLSRHMSQMLKMQDSLLKASAAELLRTDLLHVSTKQQRTHTEFPINSYVLVHYRSGSPPTRLHTSWRGPMRVVSGSNSRYTLYDLITNKEKEYHVSDMKQFLYDPNYVDPVDVARRDHMEFFVESIVSHRGNLNRSAIEFLVKWRDYPESENSWEPYSSLRDNAILHDYLKLKNLHRLINKQHR